jgi:hypothetical protein
MSDNPVFSDPELVAVQKRLQTAIESLGGTMKLGFVKLQTASGEIAIPAPDHLMNTFASQQQMLLELHRQTIMQGALLQALLSSKVFDKEALEEVTRLAHISIEAMVLDIEKKAAEAKKPKIAIAKGRLPADLGGRSRMNGG